MATITVLRQSCICPHCHYQANVLGERRVAAWHLRVTIVCFTCQELYETPFEARFCSKSPEHPVEVWKEPWLCPKCSRVMMKIKLQEQKEIG